MRCRCSDAYIKWIWCPFQYLVNKNSVKCRWGHWDGQVPTYSTLGKHGKWAAQSNKCHLAGQPITAKTPRQPGAWAHPRYKACVIIQMVTDHISWLPANLEDMKQAIDPKCYDVEASFATLFSYREPSFHAHKNENLVRTFGNRMYWIIEWITQHMIFCSRLIIVLYVVYNNTWYLQDISIENAPTSHGVASKISESQSFWQKRHAKP